MRPRKNAVLGDYNEVRRTRRAEERREQQMRDEQIRRALRPGEHRRPLEMAKREQLKREIARIRWVA